MAVTEPVGELWEEVAVLTVAAIDRTEQHLRLLQAKRRRLARILVDDGYSKAATARLLGVTNEGLRQMLRHGQP